MIVRVLLWSVAEADVSLDALRELTEALDPLPAPGGWLSNDVHERFGALLLLDEDELDRTPPQIAEVRSLLGRDPDLFDEFDLLR